MDYGSDIRERRINSQGTLTDFVAHIEETVGKQLIEVDGKSVNRFLFTSGSLGFRHPDLGVFNNLVALPKAMDQIQHVKYLGPVITANKDASKSKGGFATRGRVPVVITSRIGGDKHSHCFALIYPPTMKKNFEDLYHPDHKPTTEFISPLVFCAGSNSIEEANKMIMNTIVTCSTPSEGSGDEDPKNKIATSQSQAWEIVENLSDQKLKDLGMLKKTGYARRMLYSNILNEYDNVKSKYPGKNKQFYLNRVLREKRLIQNEIRYKNLSDTTKSFYIVYLGSGASPDPMAAGKRVDIYIH
jgi:hypothetical protein